jgi:hypothetical protein
MLYLNPNSGEQIIYLTLQDAARDYSYTHYLFQLVNRTTRETFYFVADVETDNPRYTAIRVRTNIDNTNNVLITEFGEFDYFVFVQNSSTNKDPSNVNVVAQVEQGTLKINGPSITQFPTIAIPTDYVYYEN